MTEVTDSAREAVEVTEVDREAAKRMEELLNYTCLPHEREEMAFQFARHRIAAEARGAARAVEGYCNWLDTDQPNPEANEALCDALRAEIKRQREAGVFVAHPIFVLFADALKRGDWK